MTAINNNARPGWVAAFAPGPVPLDDLILARTGDLDALVADVIESDLLERLTLVSVSIDATGLGTIEVRK